jgi:hypothetical protein
MAVRAVAALGLVERFAVLEQSLVGAVGLSAAAFAILAVVCHGLGQQTAFYRCRPPRWKAAVLARLLGPWHALVVGLAGLQVAAQALLAAAPASPGLHGPEVPGFRGVLAFSFGHLLVDSAILLLRHDWVMVLHHGATMLAEYLFMSNLFPSVPSCHLPTAIFLATELSTPFLQASALLNLFEMDQGNVWRGFSLPALLAALGTLASWLFSRILTLAWLSGLLLSGALELQPYLAPAAQTAGVWGKIGVTLLLHAILSGLNLLWFTQLLRKLLAGPQGGKRKAH